MTYIRPKHSRDRQNAYDRARREKYRSEVHAFFGNKCNGCDFTNPVALQVDHLNGGGRKERQTRGGGLGYLTYVYKQMMENPVEFRKKYQLLCANCNVIKKYLNGEH